MVVPMVEIQVKPLINSMEEILDSSIQLRVVKLMVILPEKDFTGREIATLLGVSHSNVQRAMRILVDDGLVWKRRIGSADVFRTNKEHFLYEPLRNLFTMERRLPDMIVKDLRSMLGDSILSIVVFGSYARGNAGRRSDFDVLVVAKDPNKASRNLPRLETNFLLKYQVPLSVKVLSPSDLRKRPLPSYIQAASEEGILLFGDSLKKVMAVAH